MFVYDTYHAWYVPLLLPIEHMATNHVTTTLFISWVLLTVLVIGVLFTTVHLPN
jgi:hypothetical protein